MKQNLHPSLKVKEFVVKDEPAYRLRVRSWQCLAPTDSRSIEFIQECMRDGEVEFTSTYTFLMTEEELKVLAKGLVNED